MDALLRLAALSLILTSVACSHHAPPTATAPETESAQLARLLAAFEVVPEISKSPATGPSDQAVATVASTLKDIDVARNVIVNNIANARTTAFKRSRTNFENLAYLTLKESRKNRAGETAPAGVFVGVGARLANTQLDLGQGSLEATNRQLDLAIQGDGFFKVKIQDTVGNGIGYTRNGNLFVNNLGELVLGMGDGFRLNPSIKIPTGSTDITIATDGTITYLTEGSTTKHKAGRLHLTQFVNPQGLQLLADSLYLETNTSGPPITSDPGVQGAGTILQGFLESSNVDLTHELTQLQLLVRWRNALLAAVGTK